MSVELSPSLVTIADALIARSNGRHDADFVRGLVAQVAAGFEEAFVRDYVDVLIAKEAADELRRLDGLLAIAS
jgi:hypothetical protein